MEQKSKPGHQLSSLAARLISAMPVWAATAINYNISQTRLPAAGNPQVKIISLSHGQADMQLDRMLHMAPVPCV